MRVSVLFGYAASSLPCSSLWRYPLQTMFRSDPRSEDERRFLCTRGVRGCNVRRAVFSCSMIAIYWAEKYMMEERRTRWEGRVWLYWIILSFSWFGLCHVDVEWIVSIGVRSQSFDDLALIDRWGCVLIVLLRSRFST